MEYAELKSKKIMFVALLNVCIVILELLFGSLSNSLSLITDALHNLGDVLALFVAFIAAYYALKSATSKMTFGYIRAEMMAAFVNALFLCITMLYVLYEALVRFMNPEAVEALSVIVVASVALVINGISAYLLKENHGAHHHHDHEDLNLKAAYLHMLGDALISLGVVLGAVVTFYFDTFFIDPLLTFFFGAYILKSSFKVLKKSFLSLMDANTEDIKAYEDLLLSFDEVLDIHDVHLTSPSSKEKYFSAHIVLKDEIMLQEFQKVLEEIRLSLKRDFGVTHSLLQPETMKYAKSELYCTAH